MFVYGENPLGLSCLVFASSWWLLDSERRPLIRNHRINDEMRSNANLSRAYFSVLYSGLPLSPSFPTSGLCRSLLALDYRREVLFLSRNFKLGCHAFARPQHRWAFGFLVIFISLRVLPSSSYQDLSFSLSSSLAAWPATRHSCN